MGIPLCLQWAVTPPQRFSMSRFYLGIHEATLKKRRPLNSTEWFNLSISFFKKYWESTLVLCGGGCSRTLGQGKLCCCKSWKDLDLSVHLTATLVLLRSFSKNHRKKSSKNQQVHKSTICIVKAEREKGIFTLNPNWSKYLENYVLNPAPENRGH